MRRCHQRQRRGHRGPSSTTPRTERVKLNLQAIWPQITSSCFLVFFKCFISNQRRLINSFLTVRCNDSSTLSITSKGEWRRILKKEIETRVKRRTVVVVLTHVLLALRYLFSCSYECNSWRRSPLPFTSNQVMLGQTALAQLRSLSRSAFHF